MIRCRFCNVEIPRHAHRPGSGRLCVNCRDEADLGEDRAALRSTAGWVLALSVLVLAVVLLGGDIEGLEDVWYLHVPVIGAFALLGVFPHELAHALAYRLLGGQAYLVEVGRGPRGRRRRFLGIDWRVRSVSSTGLTFGNLLTAERYRLRSWCVSAAGPGSHLVAMGVGVAVTSQTSSFLLAWLARDFAIANGIDLFQNLRPARWRTERGEMRSDGAALLEIPRMDPRAVLLELAYSYDGANEDVGVGSDTRRALERLRRLRGRNDLVPFGPAFLDAGIAWALLLSGDAEGMPEAAGRSAAAWQAARALRIVTGDGEELALAAVFPTFGAIRGCVLMETGSLATGGRMVMDALPHVADRHQKALFLCLLALGALRYGERRLAEDFHESARAADRRCPLLPRVEDARREATAESRDLPFGHGVPR